MTSSPATKRARARLGIVLAASVASSCAALLPAPVPMHWIREDANTGHVAKCLLVLMPGFGDDDTEFFRQGFIDAVRKRHLSVDVVAADATIGYYAKGIVWTRVAEDVIQPEQARGYKETWLTGISMGGLGVTMYPRVKPGTITGVLALAPFLGDKALIDEIQAAGGVKKWNAPPPADQITNDTYQRELWRWLKAVTSGAEQGPKLYIGFGSSDGLAPSAKLLAAELPPDHVFETEGKHTWEPWMRIWNQFLDESDFAKDCK